MNYKLKTYPDGKKYIVADGYKTKHLIVEDSNGGVCSHCALYDRSEHDCRIMLEAQEQIGKKNFISHDQGCYAETDKKNTFHVFVEEASKPKIKLSW